MTRSAAIALTLSLWLPLPAFAQAEPMPEPPTVLLPSGEKKEEAFVEKHRTPFDELNERAIGQASRAVRVNWRQKTAGVAFSYGQLLELNNFSSATFGGLLRLPAAGLMFELGASWVHSWGSDSSEKLALTPYRQVGRPSRLEIDINASLPLFEGVSTPRFGFIPATELVFSLTLGFRYNYYLGSMSGMPAGDVIGRIFSAKLNQQELDNLERWRLPSMQIDPARYQLLLGGTFDIFFAPGAFVTPRALIGLPLFSLLNGVGLSTWWELGAQVGWLF